jgi:hypothetical protein
MKTQGQIEFTEIRHATLLIVMVRFPARLWDRN